MTEGDWGNSLAGRRKQERERGNWVSGNEIIRQREKKETHIKKMTNENRKGERQRQREKKKNWKW